MNAQELMRVIKIIDESRTETLNGMFSTRRPWKRRYPCCFLDSATDFLSNCSRTLTSIALILLIYPLSASSPLGDEILREDRPCRTIKPGPQNDLPDTLIRWTDPSGRWGIARRVG
jgi:hypothetical protein